MELITAKLLGFMLVLTRVSAFFMVSPVFSWQSIPVRIKAAIVLLLTIFLTPVIPSAVGERQVSSTEAIMLLCNEAVYGLALGLVVVLIFSVIRLSGEIIENQMGLTMAELLDPLTGENSQPLSGLLEMIFILLFLVANGHHLLLLIVSRSYDTFPVGSIPTVPLLLSGTVKAASTMFVVCLRLAAPMLAAFLLLIVALAVFARIMPDMDIFFISMPLSIGLGLMMMVIFLPFINEFTGEFADWMGKLLPL